MDERALRTQKAFFVRIQNRHKRHFWNVQALTQQVDTHQHIKSAQAQVAQNFYSLDRVHVAVQITHFDAVVAQVVGQLLGHALGQGGDQHALVLFDADADFLQHVVHLRGGGAHLHFWVHQAGGAHQLLHHLAGMVFFPLGRRGRDKNSLAHLGLKFFELERTVVQRAGQAKAVFHQRGLA